MRRHVRAAVALAAPIAALLLSPAALAHFQTYPYTLRGCPASTDRQIDPITNVFYGGAWAAHTLNHIQAHARWSNTGGSRQYFSSHGVCGEMAGQRASGGVASSRYHIRIRKTYDNDSVWGVTSRGDAHHEDFVWYCGHAVDKGGVGVGPNSGFDQGRRAIYNALYGIAHHHFAGNVYWGNTRTFRQCDGDLAGSNGYVGWFRVPDWYH